MNLRYHFDNLAEFVKQLKTLVNAGFSEHFIWGWLSGVENNAYSENWTFKEEIRTTRGEYEDKEHMGRKEVRVDSRSRRRA